MVAADPDTRGDLWRLQPWVPIPSVAGVRPSSYATLAVKADALAGKRFGVPRMYINADPEAGTSEAPGIGGPTGQRIITRASVIDLWQAARAAIEAQGGVVIEVDFPLVSNCEGDRPGAPTVFNRGLVSKEFLRPDHLRDWAACPDRGGRSVHLRRLPDGSALDRRWRVKSHRTPKPTAPITRRARTPWTPSHG